MSAATSWLSSVWSSIAKPFGQYAYWLHLQWPDTSPEQMPRVGDRGATGLREIRLAGDLLGVPLLKMAAQTGADAVRAFVDDGLATFPKGAPQLMAGAQSGTKDDPVDLLIVGGGVSGISAALEAQKLGVRYVIVEARSEFATIADFTKGKPIFTYPTEFIPASSLQLMGNTKESLLADLRRQATEAKIRPVLCRVRAVKRTGPGHVEVETLGPAGEDVVIHAKRVLISIGKSGDFRKLSVKGESLGKVHHRLFDPAEYKNKWVLVVGGGDNALESAVILAHAGADVHLSYRKDEFIRAKPELIQDAIQVLGDRILMQTEVEEIREDKVLLKDNTNGDLYELENEAVFAMIGREAPTEFLKRSQIPLIGAWDWKRVLSFIFAFSVILFIYRIKTSGTETFEFFNSRGWFPLRIPFQEGSLSKKLFADQFDSPGFYYELLYTAIILGFGLRRILKYPTPYIRRQTLTLMGTQLIPLLLLPYLFLPLMDHFGLFEGGTGKWIADQFFPRPEEGAPREFWRAVGFILAWPLFIWNIYTAEPMWAWLFVSLFQTFLVIPFLVKKFGKGAYCGWLCSCGAMAETLGDMSRTEMPHGPKWNKLNMAGQVILALSFVILLLRIVTWVDSDGLLGEWVGNLFVDLLGAGAIFGVPLNYSDTIDYFLAGVLGMGLYFHFSGRVWCRFFCPLSALMHIYARFSEFRIFSKKEKCIYCGVCTRVCHQGIDIASFAVRGIPMSDPQCVRCSACVYHCPTGTLEFGHLDSKGNPVLDQVVASNSILRELKKGV